MLPFGINELPHFQAEEPLQRPAHQTAASAGNVAVRRRRAPRRGASGMPAPTPSAPYGCGHHAALQRPCGDTLDTPPWPAPAAGSPRRAWDRGGATTPRRGRRPRTVWVRHTRPRHPLGLNVAKKGKKAFSIPELGSSPARWTIRLNNLRFLRLQRDQRLHLWVSA